MSNQYAVSYHDVLIHNGFIEQENVHFRDVISIYRKTLDSGKKVHIDVHTGYWQVYSDSSNKSVRMEALIMDKLYSENELAEHNDDVYRKSIQNLNKAFKELGLSFVFKYPK